MFIESFRESYELCAFCPKMCRFACPVADATGKESLTPWALMGSAYLALHGRLSIEEIATSAFACTGCGACTQYCDHKNDVASALVALRAEAAEEGVAPDVCNAVAQSYVARASDRASDSTAHETVFLPGCGTHPSRDRRRLRSMRVIFEKLGAHALGFDDDQDCCGVSLYWAGHLDEFDDHAAKFVDRVRKRKTLVMDSSSCAWVLSALYPRRGHRLSPTVLHVSQWLDQVLSAGVLQVMRSLTEPVVYHDACYLSRRLGITDAPRRVLARLTSKIIEPDRTRADGMCCGAKGLFPETHPADAESTLKQCATILRPPKGGFIISADSECASRIETQYQDTMTLTDAVARCL